MVGSVVVVVLVVVGAIRVVIGVVVFNKLASIIESPEVSRNWALVKLTEIISVEKKRTDVKILFILLGKIWGYFHVFTNCL